MRSFRDYLEEVDMPSFGRPPNKLGRREVLTIAQTEHQRQGEVVDELPENWIKQYKTQRPIAADDPEKQNEEALHKSKGKEGVTQFGNPIYYFGIYWKGAEQWGSHSENLSVVSYGHKPQFKQLKKIGENPNTYVCYSS